VSRALEVSPARDSAADRRRHSLDVLLLGSPRSGTTLVQRLACELPGVRVPPETHFFSYFTADRLRSLRFPLGEAELRHHASRYLQLQMCRDLPVSAEDIVRSMNGSCERILDLFAAVVNILAGPASTYGEKTPPHLLWWRPLTEALPALKVIGVVRDPRGVVASAELVQWALRGHALNAERWRADQRELLDAQRVLGPDRFLLLRYEDVVWDAVGTKSAMANFVGAAAPVALGDTYLGPPLFLPWEERWKGRALGPVMTDRVAAWRDRLSADQQADIVAICRREMASLGYPERSSSSRWFSFSDPARRVKFRQARRRARRAIHRTKL
jgi:hypothetical protein